MGQFRFFKKIMTAQSVINTTSEELNPNSLKSVDEISFYIVFGALTSAGAVQIESSPISEYAGTWAPEGTPVAWSAADKIAKVSIAGASYTMRARISTAIVGGTVDVYVVANG